MTNYREIFEKNLNSIDINFDMADTEKTELFKILSNSVSKNIPAGLFRFRECTEYNLDSFDKDEIWLSKASSFNDPHDSLLYFDKDRIKNLLTTEIQETQKQVYNIIQTQPNLSEKFKENTHSTIGYIKNITQDDLIKIINKSLPNFLNNVDSFFEMEKNRIRNKLKVACFSETINSPLMWAHYAAYHKGYALEYDFRDREFHSNGDCDTSLFPIIYSQKRYDATEYGIWRLLATLSNNIETEPQLQIYKDLLFAYKVVLHKSTDWEYEKEWRMIAIFRNIYHEIVDNRCQIVKRPKAIYFGCEIPTIYKKILSKIADEKNIKKYQMYVKDDSRKYELDYKEI